MRCLGRDKGGPPRSSERGFALPELLVVILLVGVLAAIALPTLVGQQHKGSDAVAIENLASLHHHVELCYAEREDFTQCQGAQLGQTGLPLASDAETGSGKGNGWGKGGSRGGTPKTPSAPGPGQVAVTAASATSYTIKATSNASTGGQHHVFTLERTSDRSPSRTCTPGGQGGCPRHGSW